MTPVLETEGLGKRYGRHDALADCTLSVPSGRIIGLVGPNGAGKSTLLGLTCGLIAPTAGTISVLGNRPAASADQLARVGFVAQDTPVYPGLTIADHLRMGARLNPRWDRRLAEERIRQLGLDPAQKAGRLSGGQRAQLALTIAAAKRPELLIFDEPVAALDPLARRAFLQNLMEVVVEIEVSIILSSHLLSDLERVSDYLIVLAAGRVQLAGEVDELLASHYRLTGARGELDALPAAINVVTAEHTARQSTLVVRTSGSVPHHVSAAEHVDLEDMVLAYMTQAADSAAGLPAPRTRIQTSEAPR
ncbi:ABC transporter ATP-binding protein [Embleya sp. NBC_00888]|uniref:ABC transporter ATP-binding protein n=1 Tax=Embleya sp. NBC_00888 TaxID=2975960 RepID=UPI003867AE7C|nr:ABC transporter ATP-binding protein [Embleya sp. NBC_00888]